MDWLQEFWTKNDRDVVMLLAGAMIGFFGNLLAQRHFAPRPLLLWSLQGADHIETDEGEHHYAIRARLRNIGARDVHHSDLWEEPEISLSGGVLHRLSIVEARGALLPTGDLPTQDQCRSKLMSFNLARREWLQFDAHVSTHATHLPKLTFFAKVRDGRSVCSEWAPMRRQMMVLNLATPIILALPGWMVLHGLSITASSPENVPGTIWLAWLALVSALLIASHLLGLSKGVFFMDLRELERRRALPGWQQPFHAAWYGLIDYLLPTVGSRRHARS